MKIHLALPQQYCSGLGDCLTWAWIAAGTTSPVQFVARGSNQQMLKLFSCETTEDAREASDPSFCYRAELNLGGIRPRVEIWPKILGFTSDPKRPHCIVPGEWKPIPKRIIIAPQCNFSTRTWHPGYWLDLNWSLLKLGYEVVWIMQNDSPMFKNRGPAVAHWGQPYAELIKLMRTASLVIANDSMPAHLAGTLNIPTMAILGPTRPSVFAHMKDAVQCLQSSRVECVGCHFKAPPFRVACDHACQALNTLLPSDVVTEVQKRFANA